MPANPYQVKADVTNELRNVLYYNRLEIERLITNQAGKSHKEVVDTITYLLKQNVEAESAIDLLNRYVPDQPAQPQPQVTQAPASSDENDGIKKID